MLRTALLVLFASLHLAAAVSSQGCVPEWKFFSFGCDTGHDNYGVLQRDGRPACGSGNCRGPSCWQAGGVSVTGVDRGAFTVSTPRDVQVKGETHVWVPEAKTVPFVIQFLGDCNLTVWVNGNLLVSRGTIPGSGTYSLPLGRGDNVIEWTNYHQHASTSFRFATRLAEQVTAMHTSPVSSSGCLAAQVEEYGCGPNGLNPEGSLRYVRGLAVPGSAVIFELHNPVGTQTPGQTWAFLLVSSAAMPQYPCGPAMPTWSMWSNRLPGDVLIDVTPGVLLAALPESGEVWEGAPVPVELPIPEDYSLLGATAYCQGFLFDLSTSGVAVGATTAGRVRVGIR